MTAWLSANVDLIGLAVNVAMLGVWIVYLQLLLNGYRRQRRSSILITRGAGSGVRSRCLVTNMSVEPIYVTSLIATMISPEGRYEVALTDLRDLPEDLGADPRSTMGQGSLVTGQYIDLGHFDELLVKLGQDRPDAPAPDAVTVLELVVVALYGSSHRPVGAERHFALEPRAAGVRIVPQTVETQQLRSRRARLKLRRQLARHM
ncbi:hypothetical protein [Aurantimonas sp. HBX-1]|uniref:hypothetical protein n=1 Tax=Aurantimonas sp. HBX-1 TaxID=2906072 RepID=UPI001F2C96CC|nr:hypothetical protein [Aurantimonas sp. HBX-1]UIJ71897.1 hypothetical protein LXB15_19805 [Aurantimonas sp. HBX-1]